MKLGAKLALLLLAVSRIAVLVCAYNGYITARDSLTATVMNQLTGVRRSKGSQVESYFRSVFNEVRAMSESRMIVHGMAEFRSAFVKLDGPEVPAPLRKGVTEYYQKTFLPELSKFMELRPQVEHYLPSSRAGNYLQYHYIANNPHPLGRKQDLEQAGDGSEYSNVHRLYHMDYRRFVERFGYVDLFLIDPTGTIVYTMIKEPDFVTNLASGPYRNTGLARIFEKSWKAEPQSTVPIADFEAYEPTLGQPSAFVGLPIVEGGQKIGVLA